MMYLPLSNRYLYIPIFGVSWSRGNFFFKLFLGHGVVFDLSYLGVIPYASFLDRGGVL